MLSSKDEKFLNIAINESLKSPVLHKHGCVAVVNGKLIAKGYNNYRTQFKFREKTFSCHAEIDTLRKIKNDKLIKKVTLYIARVNKKGEYKNSAPCVDCFKNIKNVKRIVYTQDMNTCFKVKPSEYNLRHYSIGRKTLNSMI